MVTKRKEYPKANTTLSYIASVGKMASVGSLSSEEYSIRWLSCTEISTEWYPYIKSIHEKFVTEDVDLLELSSLMLYFSHRIQRNTANFMWPIQFCSILISVSSGKGTSFSSFFSILLKFQQKLNHKIDLCTNLPSLDFSIFRLNLWRLFCARLNFHWACTSAI